MKQKTKYLLIENAVEAVLIFGFYLSPGPYLFHVPDFMSYLEGWQKSLIQYPLYAAAMVLLSFSVRILLPEIPLRFYLRSGTVWNQAFELGRTLKLVFVTHSLVYLVFIMIQVGTDFDFFKPKTLVMFYTFSILPALLAPVLVYRWNGALFETVGPDS